MKLNLKSLQVNKYLLAIFGVVVGVGVLSVVNAKQAGAEWDFPGLWQQVQNHEGRIKNVEADVTDLQTNTGTPPSSNRVDVAPPPVVTPSKEPTPAPEPVPQQDPTADPEYYWISTRYYKDSNGNCIKRDFYYQRPHVDSPAEASKCQTTPSNNNSTITF